MPKITRHGGPSYEEGAWPGSSSSVSEPSSEKTAGTTESESQSPAPTTATPSSQDPTAAESSSAPQATGSTPGTTSSPSESDEDGSGDKEPTDYSDWGYRALLDELKRRELPRNGNAAELAQRLADDDAA